MRALTDRISYVEKCSRCFAVTEGGATQILDTRHTNYREVAERAPLAHVDALAALGRKTTQRSPEDSEPCRHNAGKAAAHPDPTALGCLEWIVPAAGRVYPRPVSLISVGGVGTGRVGTAFALPASLLLFPGSGHKKSGFCRGVEQEPSAFFVCVVSDRLTRRRRTRSIFWDSRTGGAFLRFGRSLDVISGLDKFGLVQTRVSRTCEIQQRKDCESGDS